MIRTKPVYADPNPNRTRNRNRIGRRLLTANLGQQRGIRSFPFRRVVDPRLLGKCDSGVEAGEALGHAGNEAGGV
jgi:hypothetical protein